MSIVIFRNVLGEEVAPARKLPGNRRRRLSSIVARHADRSRPHIVSRHRVPETQLAPTNESVVLLRERRHVLCGPKDYVVITYLPLGGGGGGGGGGSGKQIGMAVASIALMIAAPYAISFLGPAFAATAGVTSSLTLLGRALSTGLIIGGVALMSMANKAKANKSNEDTRPVYGVSGGGNLPRPGDRIPVGYGRFWTLPDLSQPDYFIYSGEDQILYKRMTLGAGRYQIHSVRVGDQLLWTESGGYHAPFTGAQVEFIQPGAVSNLVPLDVTSSSAVSGLALPQVGDASAWSGPFVVSPPGVNVNYIQIDVSLPSGSYGTASSSKGTRDVATETGYEFQMAPVDFAGNPTGDWVTIVAAERFVMSKRPLRFTEKINVALGRYAVRGRNTKARFNTSDDTRMNAVQWDGLRGWRPDVRTRPGITEVALMVRSNESLGITTFQDVMIEATRIIPVWNGVAWVEQATRKSVWAFADVMRNGVYGGSILDSALDLATLGYYATAAAPFDTFDGVMRGPDSIWGVASTILATMRSEPVQLGRVWSMVRDEPKSIRRHVITRRQIVQGSTSIEFDTDPDDGAGHVIVDYDEGADPKRPVQPPDFIYGQTSLTPQRRKLFGVSSYAHAVHLGRWIAASGFFRRQTYKFSVEHEGRIYKRGDSISVEAWFASKAKVAGIVGRSGTTLTVDADIAVDAGDQIILRDRTGRQWGPVSLTGQGGNLREIIIATVTSGGIPIADALATDEMEPTTVIVGQPTVLTRNYLVKSARPSGRDRIAVEAQIDSTAVWDAIGEEIGSPPSPEAGPQTPVVPQLFYVNGEMAQGVAEPMVKWSVSPARGATGYQVEVSYDDGESWSAIYAGPDTAGVSPLAAALFNDDGGAPIILIRARAVGRTGLWSPYINNSFGAFAAGVHAGRLIDGTILAIKFAQGIEPVGIASGLPSPSGYVGPRVIVNILDNKLYRLTSEGWISTVAAEDIDGIIQAAQLAAIEASKITGQLTDAQIEAVAAAKVSGQLTNSQIADIAAAKVTGQIVDSQIQSLAAIKIGGQLSDSQIAALAAAKVTGQLTSDQIASLAAAKIAGQLTNAQIADIAAAKVTGQLTSDQIASLVAAKLTGQITGTQITDGAISTPKIATGAVVAGSIAAGAVVTEKLAIGQGRNLLPNTAFDIYDSNWVPPEFYSWTDAGLPVLATLSFSNWAPPGARSFEYRVGPGTPANGTYSDFYWLPRDAGNNVKKVPVEPGQRYEFSAWLSTHGCRACVLLCVFDKLGNLLAAPTGNLIDKVPNSDTTVNAVRSSVMLTVPAGAYYAEMRVRTWYEGVSDYAHTFVSQLFFARCLPNQTEFSAWAPGETTVIHGNGIMTRTLAADRIIAGSITAGEIAAGAITTPKLAASAVEASNIASGAIVASKMAIGDGRNVLYNSDARIVLANGRPAGWDFWWNSAQVPAIDILKPEDDIWHPPGSPALRFYYNVAPGPCGTISDIYVMRDVQSGESTHYPVQPGKRYEASAWISSHRCIARTYLYVFNREGDLIIAYEGNALDNYGIGYAQENPTRSSVITGPLPSNAYSAAFAVRSHYDGRDYPYTFVSQCLLAQAQDNQTAPSPWAPGLGVVMDGHGIVTRTISADRLIASSITSNEIAAGAIVAGKIAADAVGATQIRADAISTRHLAILDTSNAVNDWCSAYEDGTPNVDGWSFSGLQGRYFQGAHTPAFSFGLVQANERDQCVLQQFVPVIPGEAYNFSVMAYNAAPAYTVNILLFVRFSDDTTGFTNIANSAVANTWLSLDANYTVPANVVGIKICLTSDRPWGVLGNPVYWARPTMRRAANSKLIVDGSVIAGKVAAGAVVAGNIAAGVVTATELAAAAVTTPKIAAGAVTADEIAANAITTAKLSAGAVTTAKVAAGAISANELAAAAVTAGKVASNAIVAGNIAANAVVAGTVAAGAISTSQLVAGSIVTSKIAIGNITEDLLALFSATRRTSTYWSGISGTSVSYSFSFSATAGSTIYLMCRGISSIPGSASLQARINSKPWQSISKIHSGDDFTQVISAHADYTGSYTAEVSATAPWSSPIDAFLSVVVTQR